MKRTKYIVLAIVFGLFLPSCEKFDKVNQNPNSPEDVSSNYILSYVLTHTASVYYKLGAENSVIAGTMQYIQRGTNENAIEVNYYGWKPEEWDEYYDILRNVQIIYDNADKEDNNFFKAISLVTRSFVFGLLTDLYGDIPYSEALKASEGVFFPKYDQQQDVYAGILQDLREADHLLSNLSERDQVNAVSDILYNGDASKWKKFTNSLRLRYALRLSAKRAEMSAKGIDITQEFKDAASRAFSDNADNAAIKFLGVTAENSTVGGPLNSSNPLYAIKVAQPFIDQLLFSNDPRLQRWVLPVLHKWDNSVSVPTPSTFTNNFGETYDLTYMPLSVHEVDTSLYVGLSVGLPNLEALDYNKGNDTEVYHSERSPYISFLHDRYRKNNDQYLNMNLMSYDEVEFILAEAALDGTLGISGNVEEFYRKGIMASLNKWGAFEAEDFDFDDFYSQSAVNYASTSNKLERIMEQKWIASWLGVQSWFDWRRTGYPNLKAGPITQSGPVLPVRFIYPKPNLDPNYLINYEKAIERLERTNFVSSEQGKDHPYSKMWLLQGTSKPW